MEFQSFGLKFINFIFPKKYCRNTLNDLKNQYLSFSMSSWRKFRGQFEVDFEVNSMLISRSFRGRFRSLYRDRDNTLLRLIEFRLSSLIPKIFCFFDGFCISRYLKVFHIVLCWKRKTNSAKIKNIFLLK